MTNTNKIENTVQLHTISHLNNIAKTHINQKNDFYVMFDKNKKEMIKQEWKDIIYILQTLSPQKSAPFIENKIIHDHGLVREKDLDFGDAFKKAKTKKRFEIKHSFVKGNDKANFVQIRPWQNNIMIFYIFDLEDKLIHTFTLTSKQILNEIKELGQYAHGTQKANEENTNIEYAIRFKLNSPTFLRWKSAYKYSKQKI